MRKYKYIKVKNGVNVDYDKLKRTIKTLEQLRNCYYWLTEANDKYNILEWMPQGENIEFFNIYLNNINDFKQLKKEYNYLGYKLIPISKIKKYY